MEECSCLPLYVFHSIVILRKEKIVDWSKWPSRKYLDFIISRNGLCARINSTANFVTLKFSFFSTQWLLTSVANIKTHSAWAMSSQKHGNGCPIIEERELLSAWGPPSTTALSDPTSYSCTLFHGFNILVMSYDLWQII